MASSLSVRSVARLGSRLSVHNYLALGSSCSVRRAARFGSRMSVCNFLTLGSSLSMRACSQMGSGISVFGSARVYGGTSAFGQVNLGSSLSVRSFSRFASRCSVCNSLFLASSLSVRSFVRAGAKLSVAGDATLAGSKVYIGNTDNYIKYVGGTDSGIETAYSFWAHDGSSVTRRMTFGMDTNQTNYLHGTWQADSAVTLSDIRLKKNIRPLYEQLIDEHVRVMGTKGDLPEDWALKNDTELGEEPLASKMFRQLRPVAYHMKSDTESKRTNFGFIAQELQELYPSVVHESQINAGETRLSVSYQDLIAVITLTVQQEMTRLDLVVDMLNKVEGVAGKHDVILQDSETKISMLEQELLKLKRGYTERLERMPKVHDDTR